MKNNKNLLEEGICLLRQQGGKGAVRSFQKDWARENLETSLARFRRFQNSPSVVVRDWAEQELAQDLRTAAGLRLLPWQ